MRPLLITIRIIKSIISQKKDYPGAGQATHKAFKAAENERFESDAGYSGTIRQARAECSY